MKKISLLTLFVTVSICGFSQTTVINKQTASDDSKVITTKKDVVDKNAKNNASSSASTFESSTNDPENTGHTKVMINGKEVYQKKTPTINIIVDPNL